MLGGNWGKCCGRQPRHEDMLYIQLSSQSGQDSLPCVSPLLRGKLVVCRAELDALGDELVESTSMS